MGRSIQQAKRGRTTRSGRRRVSGGRLDREAGVVGRSRGRRWAGRGIGGWRDFVLRTASSHIANAAMQVCFAVVGRAGDDREPRAAVRTVEERIAEAAIDGVEEFFQAIVAGGDIR